MKDIMNFNRGQVLNGVMIGAILVSSGITWLGNYVLSSPAQVTAEIALVKEDQSDDRQRIAKLEADNQSLTSWLNRIETKLDVVIKETK